jgi:hypothetical protein
VHCQLHGTRKPAHLHNVLKHLILLQRLQCLLAKSHILDDPQIMQTVSMKDAAVMSTDQFRSHNTPQNRKDCTVGEKFREIRSLAVGYLSTRGDPTSNIGPRVKVWPRLRVCVCGFGGFPFRRPRVPNLGACAPPFKVDENDTTGQLVGDYMIGLSEDEREGA